MRYDSEQIDTVLQMLSEANGRPSENTDFGKYTLDKVIACEGQSTVVKARDNTLDRDVVLKIYHNSLTNQQRTRIVNEGRTLARIDNPNVVRCYGVEEFEGSMILVLEYVEGETLDLFLHDPLSNQSLRKIIRQLAQGVQAAHQCDCLHLDLKPQNVLITPDGNAKLIDFGLMRPISSDRSVGSGTPAFMAPEVANSSGPVDERTDIFGLGAVLYFLLSGQAPFDADSKSSQRSLAKASNIQPVDSFVTGSGVEDLVKLCNQCLEPDPQMRPVNIDAFLAQIKDEHKPRQIGRKTLVSAIVVSLILICIWITGLFADPPETRMRALKVKGLDALQAGQVEKANIHLKAARRLAGSNELEPFYAAEYECYLDFLSATYPGMSDQDRSEFWSGLQIVNSLNESLTLEQPDLIRKAQAELVDFQVLSKFDELLGADDIFSCLARAVYLRSCQELVFEGDRFEIDILKGMVDQSRMYQKKLGAESNLCLYMQESVAYQLLDLGEFVAAEQTFASIVNLTEGKTGPAEQYNYWAKLERAMILGGFLPSVSRASFDRFQEFQKTDVFGDANSEFYQLAFDFTHGRYAECIANESTTSLPAEQAGNVADVRQLLSWCWKAVSYEILAQQNPSIRENYLEKAVNLRKNIRAMTADSRIGWRVSIQAELILAEGTSALGNHANAISDIKRAIEYFQAEISKIVGADSECDMVILARTKQLKIANEAEMTDLAGSLARQLSELTFSKTGVWYLFAVDRELCTAFRIVEDWEQADFFAERAIRYLKDKPLIDLASAESWESELAWFIEFRSQIENRE